jgi:alpha-1,3-rhamnosyl/mannosyltransferase
MTVSTAPALPRLVVDLRALVGEPTGIGVYTRAVVLELARRGRLAISGLSHRPISGAEELEAAGVPLAVRSAPLGVIWQQLHLPRMARRAAASVLWSPITTLPWSPGVPAVLTVPDVTALLLPSAHHARVRWSVRPFLARSLRQAKAVIAISRATARDLARLYPWVEEKTSVIHCGVDPEFVPGAAAEIERTRAELDAPGGFFLYAGTIEPRKNLATLLRAWEGMADAPPLVLAGPYGWHSEEEVAAIQRLRDLGRPLRWLGRVERPRLVRLMQAARVFVYPSLYEGFGLPPLEAMACGVPIVASNAASLPEVVGQAGVLVEPSDAEALSEAMRRVWEESGADAQRRRAASLAQAASFSWARAAEEHERLLLGAAGAPG